MDDSNLRIEFQRALDPVAPPAPWLAASVREELRRRRHENSGVPGRRRAIASPNWLLPMVAVLLGVAIVVTLVVEARALNPKRSVPVHPAPQSSHFAPCASGAQPAFETIAPFGMKMINRTTGWALGQCVVPPQATPAATSLRCGLDAGAIQVLGILRTTDGGAHWQDVAPPSVPNRTWTHAEFFLDATHAWVAEVTRSATTCADQILTFRTSDGGQSWDKEGAFQVRNTQASDQIFALGSTRQWMDFADASHGWLLVAVPPLSGDVFQELTTLYATTDAGLHWSVLSTYPGVSALARDAGCRRNFYGGATMSFVSASTGWLYLSCGVGTLLVTHDGGLNWGVAALPSCQCGLGLPDFFDASHGLVTDASSVLYITSDGGASWSQRAAPSQGLTRMYFTNPSDGWTLTAQQVAKGQYEVALYRTIDGGLSWSLVSEPAFSTSSFRVQLPISYLQFVDGNVGFARVGPFDVLGAPLDSSGHPEPEQEIMTTTDGGRTWTVLLKQFAQD